LPELGGWDGAVISASRLCDMVVEVNHQLVLLGSGDRSAGMFLIMEFVRVVMLRGMER
jgi:hypothetical protein